jgi:hypothetical protein
MDLISGFSSKSIASGHFIDQRSKETIEKGDNDINLIDLLQTQLMKTDNLRQLLSMDLKERKAIYREGATLVDADFDETLRTTFSKEPKLFQMLFLTEIRNLKTRFQFS